MGDEMTLRGALPTQVRLPSLRTILQVLFVIAMWYGSDGASASYMFYPKVLEDFGGMTLNEVLMIVVAACSIILLLQRGVLSVTKSRLHVPVLVFFLTVFVPWLRMCYTEGTVRMPYEMRRNLGFFTAYALVFVLFEPYETKKLFVILLGIGIAKGVEACAGYFLQPFAESSWAALAEWRDGLVLGMMLLGWLAIFCFRDKIAQRKYLFATLGFLITAAGFIVSIRRSFIFALPLSIIALMLGLDRVHKKRLWIGFGLFVAISAAFIFLINPQRFLSRLAVVGNPLEEWSSAYRVYEYKNVLLTIADSPWFGYPMGVPWKVHTLFPLGAMLSPLVAHDVYLNILLRNGVVGLVLLGYFLYGTTRSLRWCVRTARTAFEKVCTVSLISWCVLYFVASFTAPLLTVTNSAIIGGVIIGLVGLLEESLKKNVSVPEQPPMPEPIS